MRALVVGGTRFIGLHLVRLLHSQGHEVATLNRGVTPADLPDDVERLYADRTDPSQVRSALGGRSFDWTFDISGYTLEGLNPIVQVLAGNAGIYVYCSTTSVYEPSHLSPVLEDFPLDRRPEASPYAVGKVACEDTLMEMVAGDRFPAVILRPPYVYGPGNHIKPRESTFFARIDRGRKVVVPGDGLTFQHFVHVEDLANAFATAAQKPDAIGQAYTIAGRDAITLNGFVNTIAEVMGKTVDIIHIEGPAADNIGTPVFPFDWRESNVYVIEKARRDLDWSPQYTMLEGLDMTYRWWVEQEMAKGDWDFSAEDQVLSVAGA